MENDYECSWVFIFFLGSVKKEQSHVFEGHHVSTIRHFKMLGS